MIVAGYQDILVDHHHSFVHSLAHIVRKLVVADDIAVVAVAGIEIAGHIGYTLRMPVAARSTARTHHRTTAAVAADLAEMSARLAEMLVLGDSCQCEGSAGFVEKELRRVRLARLPTSRDLP